MSIRGLRLVDVPTSVRIILDVRRDTRRHMRLRKKRSEKVHTVNNEVRDMTAKNTK